MVLRIYIDLSRKGSAIEWAEMRGRLFGVSDVGSADGMTRHLAASHAAIVIGTTAVPVKSPKGYCSLSKAGFWRQMCKNILMLLFIVY